MANKTPTAPNSAAHGKDAARSVTVVGIGTPNESGAAPAPVRSSMIPAPLPSAERTVHDRPLGRITIQTFAVRDSSPAVPRPGTASEPSGRMPTPAPPADSNASGASPDVRRTDSERRAWTRAPTLADVPRPRFSQSSTDLPMVEGLASVGNERASATAERFAKNVLRSRPETDAMFVAPFVELGVAGVEALAAVFPGPIRESLLDPSQPPQGRRISAVASVLHAIGSKAHPQVRRLINDANPRVRHAAMLLAMDMDPDVFRDEFEPRLFDDDPFVSAHAERIVQQLSSSFRDALASRLARDVRSRSGATARRQRAVELLASLRTEKGLAALVECLEDADRRVAATAHRGLCELTGRALGASQREWIPFVRGAYGTSRVEWLLGSLELASSSDRDLAASELARLTGDACGYRPGCPLDEARRVRAGYVRILSR